MKVVAVRGAGLDGLRVEQREPAALGPRQVRVRWHASSLNFHDYWVARGIIAVEDGRIPLSDGAGEIIELGDEVDDWPVGERVMSVFHPLWLSGEPRPALTATMRGDTVDGCACETSVIDVEQITPMPRGYGYAQAATLPCAALTAWRALTREGAVGPGHKVLIEGTGGVALFALQFAKALGAQVYATTSSEAKMMRLRALGADQVFNYKTDPDWGRSVAEASAGGVDVVLDSGGASTLAQSIAASRMGGTVVIVGVLGGVEASINVVDLIARQQKLVAVAVGSAAMQLDMIRAIERYGIEPVIDSSFPLERLADAFRYQEEGRHVGKIVIAMGEA